MNTTKIAITVLLMIATSPTLAAMNTDFKRCATQALEESNLMSKSIVINNPTNDADIMDHDRSALFREYRMKLVSNASGVNLGNVSCRIDESGQITSVTFLSKTD